MGEEQREAGSGSAVSPDFPTGIEVFALPERVDSANAISVEAALIEVVARGPGVVVDGFAVNYMSVAGVRTLATALRRAEELGHRMVLCRFSGAAADCLIVSGFYDLMEVVDTVEAAVDRLRTGAVAG